MKIEFNKNQIDLLMHIIQSLDFKTIHLDDAEQKTFNDLYDKIEIARDGMNEIERLGVEGPYKLSENQKRFVMDALAAGLSINYDYSGRGMFGKQCPAVCIDRVGEFGTKAETSSDSMGLGFVVYARG